METVSIRNLRGKGLRENALKGNPVAITNHRVLIGVVIPVAAAWVEHLIDYNWSHVRESIAEAEEAMTAGRPVVRIEELIARSEAAGDTEATREAYEKMALPLVAALFGGELAQAPESKETVERLRTVWNPPGSKGAQGKEPREPLVRTVRIGDLSAEVIERAGEAAQTLAITHDRELLGIVIPVTPGLVEFLIERNMSRVLYNISLGEKQLGTPDQMTQLDQVVGQPARNGNSPR
jgi:hypothetical protein